MALAIANARRHTKLADALADRERLISIAAHELRGPLCSVRLGLQALRRGRFPPKATPAGGRSCCARSGAWRS